MIKYHNELVQRSEEWYAARCGLLTASEMKHVMTPQFKGAKNEKSRSHIWELTAQRLMQHVEPSYESFDMQRGKDDELDAKILYNEHYAPVQDCGFVTNDEWGFTIGYSPDGLVGDDGLIEAKSRCQKYQVQTICDGLPLKQVPDEFIIQIQTGLLVTKRAWCDFISYSNGMPMVVIRVTPDQEIQWRIREAAEIVEKEIADKMEIYNRAVEGFKLIKTVRKARGDEIIT